MQGENGQEISRAITIPELYLAYAYSFWFSYRRMPLCVKIFTFYALTVNNSLSQLLDIVSSRPVYAFLSLAGTNSAIYIHSANTQLFNI